MDNLLFNKRPWKYTYAVSLFLYITVVFLKCIIKNAFAVLMYDFLKTNWVKQSIYL